MAWPSTPLTSYVAHSTPVIKAADLNSFQSGINGIINGTYSLAAFVVDGTGGNVVAPLAGTGMVSAAVCGTVTPLTALVPGQVALAGVPLGMAYVAGTTGLLNNGYNVFSSTRSALGVYSVIFNAAASTPTINFAFASLHQINTGVSSLGVILWSVGVSGGKQQVTINTYDLAGAAQDGTFTVGIWGE